MADVEEIIDYIKSLKKGFDADLFQSKIDELAYAADTTGLDYDDFHTLFKIWLNLSIPNKKWVSLGECLMPQNRVEERTVDYAFRWLQANYRIVKNHTKMGYLLDWLTAAMDTGCIDMEALDNGYEIFYVMLSIDALIPHAVKLIYTLTKPDDVTRGRVLNLLKVAKTKECTKDLLHIHVLLGLFKSYKPECVPEDVPAISIHTSFKKTKSLETLLARFRKCQERINGTSVEKQHLSWMNPLNSVGGKHRKAEPLVPNINFANIGSKHYSDNWSQKSLLDFSDPAQLLGHSLLHPMSRPAKLRALLCNETGMKLLCVEPESEQAFFSIEIYNALCSYFLDVSLHSYEEKRDLLERLSLLQHTALQALPLVTRFLAQFMPLWNEKDFFAEILELVEWIDVSDMEQTSYILDSLTRMYHRAQPIEQCAILNSLTNMYTNLVFSALRPRNHFLPSRQSNVNIVQMLPYVAARITDMCNKELLINPEDMRVQWGMVRLWEVMCGAEARRGLRLGTLPPPLAVAMPLLSHSSLLLDELAALFLLYKKVLSMPHNKQRKDETYLEQRNIIIRYSEDLFNFLYHERISTDQESGILFQGIKPEIIKMLSDLIPNAGQKLSARHGLTFASRIFVNDDENPDPSEMSEKFFFDNVIRDDFPNLQKLLLKAIPDLR